MDTKQWIIAAIVVLVLVIAAYAGYTYWKKSHSSGFQSAHPTQLSGSLIPSVINGLAGMKARPAKRVSKPHRIPRAVPKHEGFGGMDWPTAGEFGATADTYPYGNYADGLQMYYPTYNEYAPLWTRS